MTCQQALLNIYTAVLSKRSANNIRADVIELMRAESGCRIRNIESAMVSQRHPLGFFVCKWDLSEGRSLRLHLWNKKFNWAQAPGWEIHDHLFSFTSLLLAGSIRNCMYEIHESPTGDSNYSEYKVLYNGSQSSMKLIKEGVSLTVLADTKESTGNFYSMDAGVLHSSELIVEPALTVLATFSDRAAPIVPRVISQNRNQLVHFDRSPTPGSEISDLLEEYAEYLDGTR
jgi:hypothetical protein